MSRNTTSVDTDKTAALLDEERNQVAAHRELISKVTLEIEAILLRENLTMADVGEILNLFHHRAQVVFGQKSIKEIKELYDRL
jgi:hypothetical protein